MPVEAAAPLGDGGEKRQEDRAEERVLVRVAEPVVRAREDRGGRLARQVVKSVARVRQSAQRRRMLLDEAAHERAVLVQGRSLPGRVLLERERQLRPAFGRERGKAERAQGLVEVQSSKRHAGDYAAGGSSPT